MKTITICYLLFFIIIILNSNISYSAGFNSIHTSNGNIVIAAGDQGNIFRSMNGGNTWTSYTEPSVNFKSVFSNDSYVWLTSDNGKVYKSSIGSTVLTSYNTGVLTSINSICFLDDLNGYICGDNGVLYKSVNGGLSWTPSKSGVGSDKLNSISFKDALNGIVVGNNGKVYTTLNGGTTWTLETVSTTRNLLDVKYFSDGIAIVGEWGTLFTKSGNGSWISVDTRIKTDIRGVTGTSIFDVHVCGGGGFVRNNKNSSSVFLNFEKNPMLANLVDIVFLNSNIGFAVSSLNNAIIRTTDGGTSWSLPPSATVTYNWVSKPGASGNFLGNNMCLHPTDRNTIFIAFANQVYRSRNKGDSWTTIGNPMPSGNTPHSFYVSPIDTNIWLAAIESSPDKVYRTTDYGQTWTVVVSRNFSNYGQPLEMDQNNPSNFYFAPDNGGFYKSTDNGATFNEISNNFAFRSPCDILVQWDNSNVIFVADGVTSSGLAKLFKSTNGGVNWIDVHTNSSSSEVPSMTNTVFDKDLIYATEWPGSTVYKSTNNGDNFSVSHSTGFSGWGSDICREDPTLIVTGSWGASATFSINGGSNWTNISNGLSGHGGGILIPDRGYIIAHQGSNVYKLNITYNVVTVPPPSKITLNLKVIIEGMYFPLFNQMSRKDSVNVYLRNSSSPYGLVDSAKGKIDSISFSNIFSFPNALSGTYYIEVKHFNSIETWSKTGGEPLTNDGSVYNYDFTTSISKSYGNNMILKGSKYCIYNGDVNQDRIIDAADISRVENDKTNSVSGFVSTDLNGDFFVDAADLSIVDNNKDNGVIAITP